MRGWTTAIRTDQLNTDATWIVARGCQDGNDDGRG
jgi:hypothetical protein